MTQHELFIKVFADFSGKTEADLLSWSVKNMTAEVKKSMSTPIPDDQVEKLMAEYKANPLGVINVIAKGLGQQPA